MECFSLDVGVRVPPLVEQHIVGYRHKPTAADGAQRVDTRVDVGRIPRIVGKPAAVFVLSLAGLLAIWGIHNDGPDRLELHVFPFGIEQDHPIVVVYAIWVLFQPFKSEHLILA